MKIRPVNVSLISVAVLAVAVCSILISQLEAVMWHLTHGRDLTWDNHTVTVPLLWRPVSSEGNKGLALAHATISGAEAELRVTEDGPTLESVAAASKWQQESVALMNSKIPSSSQFEPYTVVTTAGDAFCISSGKDDVAVSFVCRVVGTDWDIRFLGNERDILDARGMVASLR